ncbi:unnamed protein product [Closterium sp. NIES-54]
MEPYEFFLPCLLWLDWHIHGDVGTRAPNNLCTASTATSHFPPSLLARCLHHPTFHHYQYLLSQQQPLSRTESTLQPAGLHINNPPFPALLPTPLPTVHLLSDSSPQEHQGNRH